MRHLKETMLMLGVVTSLLMAFCSKDHRKETEPEPLSNSIILEWNDVAYHAFGGAAYQHSLMASRINAMTHIAMHDALNAIVSRYATYAFTGKDAEANIIVAAATAAHTVLLHEIPTKKEFLDSALQQSLSTIKEGNAKERGIQLGKEAAQAIITARSNDGAAGDPLSPVPPSDIPGVYQTVPPFNFVFAPYWENVKPFALQRKDQFRSVPPPSLNSAAYATAFKEVKETGKINSTSRTADQLAYAQYWYEFSEAGWNRVASVVAADKKLGLWETARLFALVDIAMADAYIAGWDSKFHYNFWRPYTAIRNAGLDDNHNTIEDLHWETTLPTPPVQDYPSTHSALGKAAATVLASILGDQTPFTMPSPTAVPAGGTRSFTSFSQAAYENADSRVRAGIHFRFACDAGLELGDKIGKWVASNYLKPIN